MFGEKTPKFVVHFLNLSFELEAFKKKKKNEHARLKVAKEFNENVDRSRWRVLFVPGSIIVKYVAQLYVLFLVAALPAASLQWPRSTTLTTPRPRRRVAGAAKCH